MPNEYFIGECDSCHFKDIEIKTYRTDFWGSEGREERMHNFCDICSHTLISHHVSYPGQYPNWIGALGYIGNAIIKAIKEKNEQI